MSQQPRCQSFVLNDVLNGKCDLNTAQDFESHLESCVDCQQELTRQAAVEIWWTKATDYLSTVEQWEVPPDVRSKLADSRSFVIPTLVTDQAHADVFENRTADWRQILDPPTHPEMLGRIDQFEIEDKIGQGGMGIVLKGFDRHLNRAVAIKVLTPHLASNGTSRRRFAREAQAAAAVVHPNVIPIYAVKSCESRPYIVMQLVSGHSLQSLVCERGPLELKELIRVMIQVADGLAAAHKQGLIHRDIKPGNVLIEHDVSRVMITDFGLARAADDAGMTQTGWIAGTPHYMSPEQARGDSIDGRSDLFSLGSLMFYLATGREPFRAEKPFAVIQKIITEQPPSVQELNSDLPATVSEIIEKLHEKEPQDRFQSADEVKQLLEHYLAYLQQPMQIAKPTRLLTSRRKRQLRKTKLGFWLVGLSLVVLTGWIGVFGLPDRWRNPANSEIIRTTTNPPAADLAPNADRLEKLAAQPNNAGFFSDDSFSDELMDLQSQIETLEQSLKQTNPLDQNLPTAIGDSGGLFTELKLLNTGATIFEREEERRNQSVRKLLDLKAREEETNPILNPRENP